MSKIIKEQCQINKTTIRCLLLEDNYDKSFAKINRLVVEATNDFPFLSYKDITIVIYGGTTRKRIMGIEFNVKINSNVANILKLYTPSTLEFSL